MRYLPVFFALAVFVSTTVPATAETYYVNNAVGLDTNSGLADVSVGRSFGPMRSIAAALRRAKAGDRIVLANTGLPYQECITLQGSRHSGSALRAFEVDGNGATLDGSAPIPSDAWRHVSQSIYRFHPDRLGFQQLFLDGRPCEHVPIDAAGNLLSMVMRPGQWCNCAGAIQFAADKGELPTMYDLSYAKHRVGITLYDVRRVVIRNLTVRGFQLDGFNAHDNAMDCQLSQVNAEANGRSGFSIGGASRLRLTDCKSTNNAIVPLRVEGRSRTEVVRTNLVSDGGPSWIRVPDVYGLGARLVIDNQLQTQPRGRITETQPTTTFATSVPPHVD